jgi:hypothetical protein
MAAAVDMAMEADMVVDTAADIIMAAASAASLGKSYIIHSDAAPQH